MMKKISFLNRLVKFRLPVPTDMEALFNVASLKKGRNITIVQHVAESEGLESPLILKLVDAVGSKKLSLSIKLKLMKCIIPKSSVPEDAFLRMTSYLNDFKLELELKVEILKWIIIVLPFCMENPDLTNFHCLYETFLILLRQEVLRPYVIYLLLSISTKNHITVDRLEYIVKLQEENDLPCFNFLLSGLLKRHPKLADKFFLPSFNNDDIFDIYPLLETEILACKSSLNISPKYVNSPKESLAVTLNSENSDSETLNSFHLEVGKTHADQMLSETHDCREDPNEQSSVSVYGSFGEVYKHILYLKESSIKNILSSNLRRLLFTCDMALSAQTSFLDYILTSFWCSSCDFNSTLPLILEALREMQVPTIAVSDFMRSIIDVWDGYSSFHAILEILSYLQIGCFESKVAYTLDPLLELIKTSDVVHKCHILHCFTTIYQNWALFEFSDCDYIICKGSCSLSKDITTPFGIQGYHLPMNEIYKFGCYIDTICDDLLSNDDFHPCLLNRVLLHYKKISASHSGNDNLVLHLPTPTVFISSLFSLNSLTLEVLCQLMLCFCNEVYSETKTNHPEAELAKRYFKSCLFDLGNILWIMRDYRPNEQTYISRAAVFKNILKNYPGFTKQFVVYMHPALLLKTIHFCDQFSITPLSIRHIPETKQFFAGLSEDGFVSCAYIMNFFHDKYTDT